MATAESAVAICLRNVNLVPGYTESTRIEKPYSAFITLGFLFSFSSFDCSFGLLAGIEGLHIAS